MAVSVTVPGSAVSSVVGVGGPLWSEVGGPAGGRIWTLVCALGVVYVVVVDDVVYVLEVALLDGAMKMSGGADESSEVRITKKINTPIRSTPEC